MKDIYERPPSRAGVLPAVALRVLYGCPLRGRGGVGSARPARLLDRYEQESDEVLGSSQRLAGLDLESRKGMERAVELLSKEKDSVEWWALVVGVSVADLRNRLRDGDTPEAAKAGAARVSATRRDGALLVVVKTETEPQGLVDLEDRVGALDGRVAVERAPGGGVRIRAKIPCE